MPHLRTLTPSRAGKAPATPCHPLSPPKAADPAEPNEQLWRAVRARLGGSSCGRTHKQSLSSTESKPPSPGTEQQLLTVPSATSKSSLSAEELWAPGIPTGLGRIQAGSRQAQEPGHVPAKPCRGARTEPGAEALLGAVLKCMSCAGPNDEQSCQTRSLSQLIISNEGRVSGSPRSWAAASHSAQLQQREKITKCHCAGLAAQSLIRQNMTSCASLLLRTCTCWGWNSSQAGNIPASATQPAPPLPLQEQHSPV